MSAWSRLRAGLSRVRRFERREIAEFRRWLEDTRNFVHVSLLVVVPLLIGLVTFLSNTVEVLPFLLFPPLASGTHALFTAPESKQASLRRFVGGMTTGALCGWIALTVATQYWQTPAEGFHAHPAAAALGVLLTGLVTWLLDIEESQAFSAALLVLVAGVTQFVYVVSVFVSSLLVAGVFHVWRREVYEQRAEYLYQTVHEDDDVVVVMRGDETDSVSAFGAQLAAAHEAGKVVLLAVVSATGGDGDETSAAGGPASDAEGLSAAARETADSLEARAAEVTDRFGVPCEVGVVTGDPEDARTVTQTAREMSCDLIVTPYEREDGQLSRFVRGLFAAPLDVVVVQTDGTRTEWRRILVPVRRSGDVAHAMLDFAGRRAGAAGRVAVCRCVDGERERRNAEAMLADLAETFERAFETRVATMSIGEFLAANAGNYDLTVIGSSTDRTAVSRFIDRPTFEGIDDLDCDLAIVHRGRSG
jgi:hypothetical protein